jgi:acetate kinase
MPKMILTINGGSSSIKFALYEQGNQPDKIFSGQISRIGLPNAEFTLKDVKTAKKQTESIKANDYSSTISWLISRFEKQVNFDLITAIGHRVVHGMKHTEPALITSELLEELKEIIPYDPDHLPNEIKLIEAFRKYHPKIAQFACFDTAFHQTMPRVAKLLPIPRRFEKLGIQRYGFHGLSYQYLMQELENQDGKGVANGRIILAHLGNGASLTAVYQGKSIDTSMGFTPAGGLPMSSRSGDLDPGVCWMMMKTQNLSPGQFNHLINHESGLLGISETSADMGDLLKQEATDARSAEAVNLFCYQVKKWIGAFAAALGGVDTLVFAGGIGENAPIIRARICEGLGFLGIELDEKRNNENAPIISGDKRSIAVRVIATDEELMIAKIVSTMTTNQVELN